MAHLLEPRFCDVPRCGHKHHAKGLCWMHYERRRLHGSIDPRLMSRDGPCQALGCQESILAKGRCQKHYLRQRARAAA